MFNLFSGPSIIIDEEEEEKTPPKKSWLTFKHPSRTTPSTLLLTARVYQGNMKMIYQSKMLHAHGDDIFDFELRDGLTYEFLLHVLQTRTSKYREESLVYTPQVTVQNTRITTTHYTTSHVWTITETLKGDKRELEILVLPKPPLKEADSS